MDHQDVKQAASKASDHPALEAAARVGYATSGLLHLLIGWITLQVAFGGSGKNADQSGALASLAGNGAGKAALWVGVVGFLGLAIWQVVDALVGHPGDDKDAWGGRAKAAARRWSTSPWPGRPSSSRAASPATAAARASTSPPSCWTSRAVAPSWSSIGLAVIGVGLYHVYKGGRRSSSRTSRTTPAPGPPGPAGSATSPRAWPWSSSGSCSPPPGSTSRPQEASGLDGALKSLRDEPFGTVLLVVMAAGFAAFGLYSFSRAKHAKV